MKTYCLILISFLPFFQPDVENQLHNLFTERNRKGTIIIYYEKDNKYYISDKSITHKPFIPASTFKILNSMIALETGSIKDIDEVIKWDSIDRGSPNWNKDTDMKLAFKNSTVWFYQELAKRTGKEKMQEWIEKSHYGNENTNFKIEDFWLNGELRITPIEQINFLERLYYDKLPFSKTNMEIVKSVMFIDHFDETKIYGKTGWGQIDGEIGWFVGYVVKNNEPIFFTTCLVSENADENFASDRIRITYEAFRLLGII